MTTGRLTAARPSVAASTVSSGHGVFDGRPRDAIARTAKPRMPLAFAALPRRASDSAGFAHSEHVPRAGERSAGSGRSHNSMLCRLS
jgi:hypothetical protein